MMAPDLKNGPESEMDIPGMHLGQELPSGWSRFRRRLVGQPKDLADRSLFHRLSLIPFLAWVGLGADGLSSSAYGPEEAFRALGGHTYLAVGLALLTATTVLIIASAYSRIIEQFPHGGGGYLVATKLLGERVGVISGCALLVDYVLTITVSIAAAGDALFSFVPLSSLQGVPLHDLKVPLEILLVVGLTTLNIRGVRESVLVLLPIFVIFLLTHVLLIGGGIIAHGWELPSVAGSLASDFRQGLGSIGIGAMLIAFVHAYSLGGGTYTGLEAVSNGLTIMREPRVQTAKRTMLYMSISLAFTAGGLLLCYLLVGVRHQEGRTLNAVLADALVGTLPIGATFVLVTILSEGALLVVGAQAGFIDGPRVLANMAVDSWFPRRFAALSDRLTTQNGILLMGLASLGALVYTRGDVRKLVVMYSINVFLTFSLSMFGMLRYWLGQRALQKVWRRRAALFTVGFVLCATILVITTTQKFTEGGWITLVVTGSCVLVAFLIRRHYRNVGTQFVKLNEQLRSIEAFAARQTPTSAPVDPELPTAAVLVGSYSGLGIHTLLHIHRAFPGHFKNILFVSVGVIDSGGFKGEGEIERLREATEHTLTRYVELARRLGYPAEHRAGLSTEVIDEAENLCVDIGKRFSKTVFFTGKIIFQREAWYQRLLHNETAFAIQKRLQWRGMTMVVLPVRVR